jgi:hypothetical protein
MFNFMFSDFTYKNKIQSVTLVRSLSFFIWKFFIGLIFYFLAIKFAQNYYITKYLLVGVNFQFSLITYVKIYILSTLIVILKVIVFQNYEETVTKFNQTAKIILDPKHQTMFFIFNSILFIFLLKICEKQSYNKLFKKNKSQTEFEWYIIIYR